MEEYVERLQKLVNNGAEGEEIENLISLLELTISTTELLDKMKASEVNSYQIGFNMCYVIESRLEKLEEAMK